MYLMFALRRRPNVLPTGDFGVRAAIKERTACLHLPKPGGDGAHRRGVAPLLFRGVLVSVAQSRQPGSNVDLQEDD